MSDIIPSNFSSYLANHLPEEQKRVIVYSAGRQEVWDIIRRLKKRRLLIIFVAVLIVVPVVVATVIATSLYRSSVVIQVNPDTIQVLPYPDVADSGSGVYFELYMSTQDQVLRSSRLLRRVAERLEGGKEGSLLAREVPFLGERFQVSRVPNTQLFKLSYLASSPESAARVANIFAEEYIRQHLEGRRLTREKAREALQKELEVLERRVQRSEKGLQSYARRENLISVKGQGDLTQTRLVTLDQQLANAEAEAVVAKAQLETIQKATVKNLPERLTSPLLANLTSRLAQAENDLTNLRGGFGEKWPAVIAKREEINLLQEQIVREKSSVLAQAVAQAQLDVQAAESRVKTSSNMLDQQKDLVNRYNNASIEYKILQREVETSQKLYEGVLERLSQTSVQKGFEFGNLQVVEPATPNNEVESPKRWQRIAWACLVGLTVGIGAAFLRDFLDNAVSTLEEMEVLSQLPTLGAVPSSKFYGTPVKNGRSPAPQITDSSAKTPSVSNVMTQVSLPPPAVAEAIRAVCASILLSQTDRELRVIVITSPIPAEGKTTIVAEMGRALAESGARTLLIDADLRKPMLAEAFGIDEVKGLSLFLSGHIRSPRVCQTVQPRLFLVPAGPQPPNPVALLNSDRMAAFLRKTASSFRFILIDTPPILAVADARVLGAKADGLILVARARTTSKSLILRAKSMLLSHRINVLGTVLNNVDPYDVDSVYYRRYYHT